MRNFLLATALSLSLFFAAAAPGQSGQVDPSFNPGPGPDGAVRAIVPLRDGSIVVGGNFSQWNGTPSGSVVRLLEDGSLDTSFATDLRMDAHQLFVQHGGVIVVGSNEVVRLLGNGLQDTNFISVPVRGPVAATEDFLYTVVLPPKPQPYLELRLPDGKFDSFVYSGFVGDQAWRLVPYPGNRVFMVGSFSFGGAPLFGPGGAVGRLAVGYDVRFVLNLAVAPDGSVYAGVATTSDAGARHFAADGSPDTNFVSASEGGDVFANMAVQNDGRLLYGSHTLTLLNYDGSVDTSFAPAFTNSTIYALAVQPDGKILVGGALESVNGQAQPNIVRLLAGDTAPSPEPTNAPPVPREGFAISGRVTDGTNGIAGVRVRSNWRHVTTTDESGGYVLVVPRAGRYVVQPYRARTRFTPFTRRVRIRGDVALEDFVVKPRRQ